MFAQRPGCWRPAFARSLLKTRTAWTHSFFSLSLHHDASAACRSFHLGQIPGRTSTTPTPLQPSILHLHHIRSASTTTSSSSRWKTRQTSDPHAKLAKLTGLKSRAAYKLLEISEKHRLFRAGDTVVDLGFAPGSWAQVAVNRTRPGGRVVGIDVLPAQPPRGVSTIQGDFLAPEIREEVKRYVSDMNRGRPRVTMGLQEGEVSAEELEEQGRGVVERERRLSAGMEEPTTTTAPQQEENTKSTTQADKDRMEGRVVNVVLSDMSAPWPLVAATWLRSVSNPYRRMMNTSGMAFRDHAGSMDLCFAALTFCYDTLITGGHFLCKFYDGAEAHAFELRLKRLFEKVHRIKPEASRKESKEAYFVGLRRRAGVDRDAVLGDGG